MSYPWLASGFLLCSAVMLAWTLATRRAFPGRFRTVRGVSGALICLASAFILGLDEALPTFLAGPAPAVTLILGVATGVVGWQLGRVDAAGKLKSANTLPLPGDVKPDCSFGCCEEGEMAFRLSLPRPARRYTALHGLSQAILVLVAASQPAHAQDRPLDADFTDVYRLGGPEAPEMALFTIPGSLAFDGAGNLHVLDLAAARVVMVDPLGQLVRSVGRRGDGPGESRIPTGILVWRDGSSAIADGGRGLLNLFGPGGDFVRSVTMNRQRPCPPG